MNSISRLRVGRLGLSTTIHHHLRPGPTPGLHLGSSLRPSISLTRHLHHHITPRPSPSSPLPHPHLLLLLPHLTTRLLSRKSTTTRHAVADVDPESIFRLGGEANPNNNTNHSTNSEPEDPDDETDLLNARILKFSFLVIVVGIYATTWVDPIVQAVRGIRFAFSTATTSTSTTTKSTPRDEQHEQEPAQLHPDDSAAADADALLQQQKALRKAEATRVLKEDMDEYNYILGRSDNALMDYQSIKEKEKEIEASSQLHPPQPQQQPHENQHQQTHTLLLQTPPSAAVTTFLKRHFAYCPADLFPVPGSEGFKPYTSVLYMFTHMSITHIIFNFMALNIFVGPLTQLYGKGRTAGMFLAGGTMAAGIHGVVERIFNPAARMTRDEILARLNDPGVDKKEKDRLRSYFTKGLGASSAIWALGTISAFAAPHISVNLFFIPFPITIPRVMIGLAAFDAAGLFVFDGYGFNLGHAGHLAGYTAGALLWMFWVRRVPPPTWYAESLSRWSRYEASSAKSR